jgi:hypothetical protein
MVDGPRANSAGQKFLAGSKLGRYGRFCVAFYRPPTYHGPITLRTFEQVNAS